MTHYYVVTIEEDRNGPFWTQLILARPHALDLRRTMREYKRRYPNAKSVEVARIDETEYRMRRDFENRHED